MTDARRDFRVGCYIFSLDRIPRQVEENRIPICRGLAQRIEEWGILFSTIIPHPHPPTLSRPSEQARYISTIQSTEFNVGTPLFMRRVGTVNQPLQSQPLRSQSTSPLRHSQLPLTHQISVSYQAPLHPQIHAQAPSILAHFHRAPSAPNSTQPPITNSTNTAAATSRPNHHITCTEFYRQMAPDGLI